MKLLLTGAAGFIGSRTSELLLDAGHQVVGIDNLNDYYDVKLKKFRLSKLRSKSEFQFEKIDLEDGKAISYLFENHKFDAVLNLGARAGVRASIEQPMPYLATNTLGSLHLLDQIARHGIERYLMASTSSLYAGAKMPFVETVDVTRPISPYAASKLGAEAMAFTYHHLYNIQIAIVRYFTVYGPAGRPDMSPFRFIEWIRRGEPITLYGDGEQTRDFTYIDDIARGTIAALGVEGFEIINLGGGNEPISINRMIAKMEECLGKKAHISYAPQNNADMQDTAADIEKAERLLNWTPLINPMLGFEKTVDWHAQNANWLDEISL